MTVAAATAAGGSLPHMTVFRYVYVQDESDIELGCIVWLDVIAPVVNDATTAKKVGNADDGNDGDEGEQQQQDSDEEEAEL